MTVNRSELHALIDRIPEDDLSVTRKLLLAPAVDWDVAPAGSEGEFTDRAAAGIDAAEAFLKSLASPDAREIADLAGWLY